VRVLHATAGVHGYNGVMSSVVELARRQAMRGHAPVLLAREGRGVSWPGYAYPCGLRVYDSCLSPQAVAAALRIAGDVDVVHVHVSKPPSEALLAALQSRRELVVTVHALPAKEAGVGRAAASVYQRLMAGLLASPRVRAVVVPSPPVAEAPMLRGARWKTLVVPWGADSPLPPAPPPEPRGTVRVAYVGRLSPEKGFHVLARALARAPNAELHVYGDGPLAGLARRLQSLLPGRVRLHGWTSKGRVLMDLSRGAVHALVAPSLSETFNLALAEAAWLRVPVLASRIPAHEWLLGRDYPGLFEPGDHEGLARALRGLPDAIHALRRWVERIAPRLPKWSQTVERYERVYRGAVEA